MRNPSTLLLCIIVLGAFALNLNIIQAQSNWHNLQTNAQIKIEYSDAVSCNMQGGTQSEYSFLKITNLTNIALTISYRLDYFYIGTGCATCNNNEYKFTLSIPANSTLTGDCSFQENGLNKLAVFRKYLNRNNNREFEKFELTNLTIQ